MVYELFVTKLTAPAFSAKDVLDLYLHRGSFETVLADEDVEHFNPLLKNDLKPLCRGRHLETTSPLERENTRVVEALGHASRYELVVSRRLSLLCVPRNASLQRRLLSKIPIAGVPIPLMGKSFGRS